MVQQWGSLIAVNYPARAFGISRMDRWVEAWSFLHLTLNLVSS
ncbi:MAG: hypothetical protein ACK44B_14095 [Flavobacteriales bacterium]